MMFGAIWRLIKDFCKEFSSCLGNAIDDRNIRHVILYSFFGIMILLSTCGFIAALTYGIVANMDFLLTWIGIPVLSVWVISCWIKSSKKNDESDFGEKSDPVNEELIRQRAREQYDDLHAFMFNAIQGASSITPLIRPHDLFDIQTCSPKGDHFYLTEKYIPVFQFECEIETAIDKGTEDLIQRELQRYMTKQCSRYPMLISSEAQGRSPVELLDVKNLGGHLLFECILATSDSIRLIEARRRARVERQQRQQAFIDQDYSE